MRTPAATWRSTSARRRHHRGWNRCRRLVRDGSGRLAIGVGTDIGTSGRVVTGCERGTVTTTSPATGWSGAATGTSVRDTGSARVTFGERTLADARARYASSPSLA